jgi:CheY-like chemotaxis protein
MPRVSGAEFARALREDPALSEIPIVILSGDVSAISSAAEVGAFDCLRKPVERAKLLGVIQRVVSAK